ncbi:MAG TPA: S24 family peptidase [Ktedonobacterales bacterium]|jgi:DNA polymerase V
MRILGAGEIAATARSGYAMLTKRAPTGFHSLAGDRAETPLDLHVLLTRLPATTFFVEMADEALVDSGIFVGDILVVERALRPVYGALVVVALDGELLARHYCPDSEALHLLPAHPDFAPIRVRQRARCQFLGVVTATIHRLHALPRR